MIKNNTSLIGMLSFRIEFAKFIKTVLGVYLMALTPWL